MGSVNTDLCMCLHSSNKNMPKSNKYAQYQVIIYERNIHKKYNFAKIKNSFTIWQRIGHGWKNIHGKYIKVKWCNFTLYTNKYQRNYLTVSIKWYKSAETKNIYISNYIASNMKKLKEKQNILLSIWYCTVYEFPTSQTYLHA